MKLSISRRSFFGLLSTLFIAPKVINVTPIKTTLNYDEAEYNYVVFDELTDFSENQYNYITARISNGIPYHA